ncbi:anti-sigma-F factor Fin family protein [Aquibacillus sediminis]|uniref:anti-sigma-F factor Fin family protein n=1 Tax=Aquibacillus sediminis TaxID=2574734 RepID=UPI00110993BD|nr:anti-sigma-F factor Fin family protein [Aquibacillus sediminis]
MSVVYTCKHCGNIVGELNQQMVDTKLLGWDQLTSEDRKQMIHYQDNGDVKIKIICEDCQDSLERNPHYHELDNFIQ